MGNLNISKLNIENQNANINIEASPQEIRAAKAAQAVLEMSLKQTEMLEEPEKKTDHTELEPRKQTDSKAEQVIDEKIWDMLLNWQFNSQLTFSENFSQIQEMFKLLLEQILNNCEGTMQLQMLSQLDKMTLAAISQFLNKSSEELVEFLNQYSSPNIEKELVSGLFTNAFGRRPLQLPGSRAGKSPSPLSGEAETAKAYGRQGIIYQKDARGIRMDENYQTHVLKSEKNEAHAGLKALEYLKTQPQESSKNTAGNRIFTLEDVKQANAYVSYLNQNPLKIESEKLPFTSEEYIGFSAGVLSVKTQSFTSGKGLGQGMASVLESAIDSYARQYFLGNSQALRQTSSFRDKNSCPQFQADAIQKVYRFTIKEYQEKKNVQASLLKSLQKAFASFQEKQRSPVYNEMDRYRSNIGFFSRSVIDNTLEDLWLGWNAVSKNWNEFLQYMQMMADKSLCLDYPQDRNFILMNLLSQMIEPYGRGTRKPTVQNMVRWGAALLLLGGCVVILILLAL